MQSARLGLVDADSVERRTDGRLRFASRILVAADEREMLGYDSFTMRVSGTCGGHGLPRARMRYFREGEPVTRPRPGSTVSLPSESFFLLGSLCGGSIGLRSFDNPETAVEEYRRTRDETRLAASISEKVEFVGTLVSGFEASAVVLCGSEAGCSVNAPEELCWLTGDPGVPMPSGRADDPPGLRRTAQAAFRGRILRSPTGRGFGHMNGYGCLVEAAGAPVSAGLPA
jgi:hypothetical protein